MRKPSPRRTARVCSESSIRALSGDPLDVGQLIHDLRTPLSVITGYAELLVLKPTDAVRIEASARIIEAADRLQADIDRLAERLEASSGRIDLV